LPPQTHIAHATRAQRPPSTNTPPLRLPLLRPRRAQCARTRARTRTRAHPHTRTNARIQNNARPHTRWGNCGEGAGGKGEGGRGGGEGESGEFARRGLMGWLVGGEGGCSCQNKELELKGGGRWER